MSRQFGGFEGNAQTLRILTTVEQKRADFQGVNLTYRTLLGILKYYNSFNKSLGKDEYSKQKFVYENDYNLVKKIISDTNIKLRTLDVQIVDLADEIAYAAHDLEDGLRMGTFTVDDIFHDFCKNVQDEKCKKKLEEIFSEGKDKVGFKDQKINSTEFAKLYRKEITSRIINVLINDIGIVDLTDSEKIKKGTDRKKEIGFVNFRELAQGLKKTTYDCITNNDKVYAYENNGKKMLKWLFEFYLKNTNYLPPEYRADNIINQYKKSYAKENEDKKLKKKLQKRLIIDYISGMMDEYVKTSYIRLNK